MIIYTEDQIHSGSNCKESACIVEPGFDLRLGKIPGEKGMATHFRSLALRIPWTEEPGMLQSIGSQRVRHD